MNRLQEVHHDPSPCPLGWHQHGADWYFRGAPHPDPDPPAPARVGVQCGELRSNGKPCGRYLPCPWHG